MNFKVVKGSFTIHRLLPESDIPEAVSRCSFFSVSRTDQELSIVCPSSIDIDSQQSEPAWACLKILGPLDFTLCGILADVSTVLAHAGVSIFALSTYDTDYILVKALKLEAALKALHKAGHRRTE